MTCPAFRKLVTAYTRARRDGDDERALVLLARLAHEEPHEPRWPKRSAEIHARRSDSQEELTALRRAFELQIHAEQVTRAIATARRILRLDPGDTSTEEQLQLLFTMPGRTASESTEPSADSGSDTDHAVRDSSEGPVDEIVLTEVVPGARPVALGDLETATASEIPLDTSEADEGLELDSPVEVSSQCQRERIHRDEQALRGKLLRNLPAAEVERLLETGRIVTLAPGDLCIRQGEPADCMYVILEGALIPIVEDPTADPSEVEMGTLEAGDFCGEIGLLTSEPRNASIKAIANSRLLCIDRAAVRALLRGHREILELVLRTLRLRLIDRLVRTHPLFACFRQTVRARLAAQFKLVEVREGGVIIQEGIPQPGLFVVLAGEVEVNQSSHGDDKVLANLRHGTVIGELSALYGQPAMASVVARGKCWLLHLSDGRFRKLLDHNPKLRELLEKLGEARSHENRERYGESS